ncbi:hypothetical protein [Planomonospora parontospora]|uniref:hypothetical protein n=1 Tax=Planomonospora parontospora TaxID=58119 RepID=UPI00166F7348|nr:hypothetical protein [Planomonospora parontospora]GGL52302.1 hypothetical protein GCM10014719_61990 [Planomonospora parontospora subsp. antibiotica]GII19466.1 hypothetical protein Ppa05_61920 [Planomonospora parontospora subsp. antibiotica]
MQNRPPALTVAAAVLALEGLTALLLGGYVAVETVVGNPSDAMSSAFVAGFGLLVGAILLRVAWGLLRAEKWTRSPGVLTQIFMVPVVVTLFQSDRALLGGLLAAAAVTALVALLSPPTTRVLYGDAEPSDGAGSGGA